MRHHSIAFLACLALAAASLAAQAPKPAPNIWTPPRTADGHPNLQGMYDVATMTPVERPAGIDRLVLTKEEAAAMEKYEYERLVKNDAPISRIRAAPPVGGENSTPQTYHEFIV